MPLIYCHEFVAGLCTRRLKCEVM